MRYPLILTITLVLFSSCDNSLKMPTDKEMIEHLKNNQKDFEKIKDWVELDNYSHYPLFASDSINDSTLQVAVKELKISPQRQHQYDSLMQKLGIKSICEGMFNYYETGGILWSLDKGYIYAPNGICKVGFYDVIIGNGINSNDVHREFRSSNGMYTLYKKIDDDWYIKLMYNK